VLRAAVSSSGISPPGLFVGSWAVGGLFSSWSDLECTFGDDVAVRRCRRRDNKVLLRPVLLSKKRHTELVFCTRELLPPWLAHFGTHSS